VTHRGVASRVTALAAHDPDSLDYRQLAATPGTLVLFMGLGTLGAVVHGLLGAGKDPATPAAVVAEGTLPSQRVTTATLAGLPAAATGARSPALVVIGDVVSLAETLAGTATPLRVAAAA
jgi:siroheme synthase